MTKWVSIHHMLLFININNNCAISCKSFNTSHVTLYRLGISDECPAKEFQYITCYSLSVHGLALCCIVGLFQYITCYSLSTTCTISSSMPTGFNTSHVTLYLNFLTSLMSIMFGFNTSHVTLYPCRCASFLLSYFGFNTSHVTLYPPQRRARNQPKSCFNTSHVTLYQELDKFEIISYLFQYITCYSLSMTNKIL